MKRFDLWDYWGFGEKLFSCNADLLKKWLLLAYLIFGLQVSKWLFFWSDKTTRGKTSIWPLEKPSFDAIYISTQPFSWFLSCLIKNSSKTSLILIPSAWKKGQSRQKANFDLSSYRKSGYRCLKKLFCKLSNWWKKVVRVIFSFYFFTLFEQMLSFI